jgi:hypothetical protein
MDIFVIIYTYNKLTYIFFVRLNIAITNFWVTITMNCLALTSCMNSSYVVGHESAISLFISAYRVYSVSIYNMLMWMYEV